MTTGTRMSLPARALLVGATAVAVVVLVGPALWQVDPAATDLAHRLGPVSAQHPLGTDHLGRDVLARLLSGARLSLGVSALVLFLSAVVGTTLGLLAGWVGGVLARLMNRVIDVLVSLPSVIIALIFVVSLGPGLVTILVAELATAWLPFARLAYGLTRRISTSGYVTAASALGASGPWTLRRHVVLNAARPILAHACLRGPTILIALAGLSFLGLGAQPPTPEWGAMLADARPYLERRPLLVVAPATLIMVTALAIGWWGRILEARWGVGTGRPGDLR